MSYEIASGATSQLNRSSNLGYISMGWIRHLEFVQDDDAWMYVQGLGNDLACALGGGPFTGTTTNDLVGAAQSNVAVIISPSQDTSWIFVCMIQMDGVGARYYYRHEGESSLSFVDLSDTAVSSFSGKYLCTSFFAANHKRMSSFKEWLNVSDLTVAQILAESSQSAPIVTTNNVNWLSCAVGSTIGQDQSGGGNDWTVTGTTITLSSDEPNMVIPSGGVVVPLDVLVFPSVVMGSNF